MRPASASTSAAGPVTLTRWCSSCPEARSESSACSASSREVERHALERDVPDRDARYVEQVVHDPGEMRGLTRSPPGWHGSPVRPPAPIISSNRAAEEIAPSGVAQLVRQHRQGTRPAPVALLHARDRAGDCRAPPRRPPCDQADHQIALLGAVSRNLAVPRSRRAPRTCGRAPRSAAPVARPPRGSRSNVTVVVVSDRAGHRMASGPVGIATSWTSAALRRAGATRPHRPFPAVGELQSGLVGERRHQDAQQLVLERRAVERTHQTSALASINKPEPPALLLGRGARRLLAQEGDALLGLLANALLGTRQLHEHLDLGAQHLGQERDRSGSPPRRARSRASVLHLVVVGRQEDDRRGDVARTTWRISRRGLEPVHVGHVDVEQHDRDLVAHQELQRIAARATPRRCSLRARQARPRSVRPLRSRGRRRPGCSADDSSAHQPSPHHAQQLVGIDRLRQIVPGPGLDARSRGRPSSPWR